MPRDCIVCDKELTGSQRKYCSTKCRRTHENEIRDRTKTMESITYICLNCGKEYHPKAKNRDKYCSRECAFEHKTINAKGRSPRPKIEKEKNKLTCEICGTTFESYQSKAKYCGPECRRKSGLIRLYKKNTAKERTCKWCGIEFVPKHNAETYMYCCDEHKQSALRVLNKNHKGAVSKAKRKRVYIRDGYTCKICGKRLRMDKVDTLGTGKPHPLAPTVDHIIPKSIARDLGWTKQQINAENNLQAAHFKCNCLKGNRGANDQMLLFG